MQIKKTKKKHAAAERRRGGNANHAAPTSFVALKWLSLLSFLSFSLGERGSALTALQRNHGAHNNRRKPVT